MVDFTVGQQSKSFDPSMIIMITFLLFIAFVLGYVFFANKFMMSNGDYKSKKYGKKSKKNKEGWSYAD